jgi:hypothetical protein
MGYRHIIHGVINDESVVGTNSQVRLVIEHDRNSNAWRRYDTPQW